MNGSADDGVTVSLQSWTINGRVYDLIIIIYNSLLKNITGSLWPDFWPVLTRAPRLGGSIVKIGYPVQTSLASGHKTRRTTG
jgi:hypothetical protein